MAASNQLYADDNRTHLGTFSSHWAACAAMLRLGGNPEFRSMGGDKAEDLAEEVRIAAAGGKGAA